MLTDTMETDPSSSQLEGCVVSEHTTATDIGISMFAAGGNAIDAVVATILAVGTLCPYHSDIGGSGFALVRTPDGEHHALGFRGCAPVYPPHAFWEEMLTVRTRQLANSIRTAHQHRQEGAQ